MNFWQRVKYLFTNQAEDEEREVTSDDQVLMQWLGIYPGQHKAISEITYFTCLKMLAETMGKLPLKYYQDTVRGRVRADPTTATILMTIRPNPYMTPSTLWTTTEFNCQHYGNAYIWLQTKFDRKAYGGEYQIMAMYPMAPDCVQVIMDDAGIFGGAGKLYYRYTDPKTGKQYIFQEHDVLHFKTWYSKNGILGEPVRTILAETVGGAAESQNVMNRLYKNGLTASMAMQYTGELDEPRRKQLEKRFADILTGPKAAGRVIPIPAGLTLTPLNMSLADAQFIELRKYSALQIAGAFGIKPNQINDYKDSSYSNSEMQQLSFLVDTMAYRLKMYEEEINSKVLSPTEMIQGFYYKFNEKAILRTDTKTQMESLTKGVQNAVYTPNEARGYLDLPSEEGGDMLIANGNYIPLTMVGTQYQKGGSDGED